MNRLLRLYTFMAVVLSAAVMHAAEPGALGRPPLDRMIDLNRRAYLDIKSQRFQAARYWLTEALVISETAGLEEHEMTARTYIHLAVVHLVGHKNREEAVHNFVLALKINPNITITSGLEAPGLKATYLEARERLELPPNPDLTAPAKVPDDKTTRDEPPAPAHPPRPDFGTAFTGEVDPDLPARIPAPLFCVMPLEAPRDKDLLIRCATQKQQKRASAMLYYRAEAMPGKYVAVPMSRSPKGWLLAVIPSSELVGKSVSYYAQAQLPGSQLAIYNGYPETPIAILLKGPPKIQGLTEGSAPTGNVRGHRRRASSWWLGLGAGSGAVYHGREPVDSNTPLPTGERVPVEAGFSPALAFQLEPELGYQLTERWALSLMVRYQYAPVDAGGASDAPGVPTSAVAAFLRGLLFFGSRGSFQPHVSLGVGFGRSFLAVIAKRCSADRCPLDHSDTLQGSPLGFLAGLGLLYNVTPSFGITVDVKEIVTAPKALALTELNLGLSYAHDFASSAAPAGAVRTSPLAAP